MENLTLLEKRRIETLRNMLKWRMRDDANTHQHAEAEALVWSIGIIEDLFGEGEQ